MSTEAGPERLGGDRGSAVGSVGKALLVWQRYGIHAFLAALLAVPTYVVLDRGGLEDRIRALEAERADLRSGQQVLRGERDVCRGQYEQARRERDAWWERYHRYMEEITIQNRSNPFPGR